MAEGRHGVLLWSAQSVQGTPVTPATAVGMAGYTVNPAAGGGVVALPTLGKAEPHQLREDVIQTDWSVEIQALQTLAFIGNVIRSSGVLPWMTLGFGRDPDSGSSDIWQVQDCKMHRLSLQGGQSGPITASASGVGGLKSDLSSGAQAHLAAIAKMAYDAILTRNGSAWEYLEFSAEIVNSVRVQHVGHGAAASNNRLWSYQDEGALRMTGSITRRESSEVDVQAAIQTAATLSWLITDAVGGNDLTLAFSGVKFGSEARANAPDGQETFVTPFEATGVTLS
jgi:hypothetical protein